MIPFVLACLGVLAALSLWGGIWIERTWGALGTELASARAALPQLDRVRTADEHEALTRALHAASPLVGRAWDEYAATVVWVDAQARSTGSAAPVFQAPLLRARLPGVPSEGAVLTVPRALVRLGLAGTLGALILAGLDGSAEGLRATAQVLLEDAALLSLPLLAGMASAGVLRGRLRQLASRADQHRVRLTVWVDEHYAGVTTEELLARVLSQLSGQAYRRPVSEG